MKQVIPALNVLKRSRELINNGWCKGQMFDKVVKVKKDGSADLVDAFCAVGAINRATGEFRRKGYRVNRAQIVKTVYTNLPETEFSMWPPRRNLSTFEYETRIMQYNDVKYRQLQEVQTLFDRTIEAVRASR